METTRSHFGVDLNVIPYDRSYCVIPGRFLAGFYPSSDNPKEATQKLQRLLDVGVNHVVNLTEPVEKNWAGQFLTDYEPELMRLASEQNLEMACHRFAIKDNNVPSIEGMKSILDNIDMAIQAGKVVYLHCWGGRGRTATVVGCYLIRHGLCVGEQTLQMIRYLRRTDAKASTDAPETEIQKQFIRAWQIGDNHGS